ncbi:facilitated trehalose transporter Tret1-like [Dendroctonus ponderosae]|uniref:facilitated trehalose transporter Tret1-like n=1 Tax=Dendroctonus ponderosae TaxID=77166 RepID=UPI00203653C3|nr:facilitated trehalose transporter Tret1-like [Dendroctonus ponderosae]KAH1026949.1 hypothetical protein HUJ05_000538 [Dendroctonus ponderosae]
MTGDKLKSHMESGNQIDQNGGKQWPQILAILILSIGCFTTGIQFSWSSPFSLVIVQDKENYNITEADTELFMLFQPIGMIVMTIFVVPISDLIGRKKSLLLIALPHILTWTIGIVGTSKWEFYISRFIAGFGDAAVFSCIPPYVGEITTPSVRNFWANVPTFFVYIGGFAITTLGSYFNVRTTAYICIGLPIAYFILVLVLLPESPYQLIKEGKLEEAKRSIQWLQRKEDVNQEFFSMKADVERQISESGTWCDMVRIPTNRNALKAGVFVRLSQQFCGISTFATYTQTIFQKAGGNLSPQGSSMIFTGVVAVFNIAATFFVARMGRRTSYFYSLLLSAMVLLGISIYFFIEQFQLANLEKLNWFPLAALITFVITYSLGLGLVPTLMLGELFSASIKSKGLGILVCVFGIGVMVSINLFHVMTAYVGLYSPFLLYAICCFISTFLTLRWVPETKGKTLEEIQQSLKSPVK